MRKYHYLMVSSLDGLIKTIEDQAINDFERPFVEIFAQVIYAGIYPS